MTNRMDLLEFLINNPKEFALMGPAQQAELAKNRPTPFLSIKEYVNGNRIPFQMQWYTTYYWLTGSLLRQKLYCFICLLYGDVAVISQEEGEFGSFYDKANDHQNSRCHIKNCELHANLFKNKNKFNSLESMNNICSGANRKSIVKVIQFFYLASKITFKNIDDPEMNILNEIISSLSSCEILVPIDSVLNFSKVTSTNVQKAALKALKIATRQLIQRDLAKTEYVSAQIDIIDENSFSCDKYSLIVRYVRDNEIVERFLTFFETPRNCSGEIIFETAYRLLTSWHIESKLVCITYDIPNVHILSKNINISFKGEDYIKPLVLHNCNYNLCWIIWQNCSKFHSLVSFANNLSILCSFFNDKKRISNFLESGISLPHKILNSDCQNTIKCPKTFFSSLVNFFDNFKNAVNSVLENDSWDSISILLAKEILVFLENPMFLYSLHFFNKAFHYIDTLSSTAQVMTYKDTARILQEVDVTMSLLYNLNSEESIVKLWEESVGIVDSKTCENFSLKILEVKGIFSSVVSNIVDSISKRFLGYRSLSLLDLVHLKQCKKSESEVHLYFQRYLDHFNIFNFSKLQNELHLLYDDPSKHLEPEDLLDYFHKNGLDCVYSETVKFIHFIQILPIKRVLYNNQTKYDRVKRFAECYLYDKRLFDYDIIIIERDLLDKQITEERFLRIIIQAGRFSLTHELST